MKRSQLFEKGSSDVTEHHFWRKRTARWISRCGIFQGLFVEVLVILLSAFWSTTSVITWLPPITLNYCWLLAAQPPLASLGGANIYHQIDHKYKVYWWLSHLKPSNGYHSSIVSFIAASKSCNYLSQNNIVLESKHSSFYLTIIPYIPCSFYTYMVKIPQLLLRFYLFIKRKIKLNIIDIFRMLGWNL